ncbi:unnamed protein product [Symbiodinium pilosum]|uniref:Uncharacterized protein n=1 Tax=Symbiodinium pilosum TaxID=2952 RepID=A0A812SL97_SYMPI|nr:unnamed protein product [Symbiodinium pilosum]
MVTVLLWAATLLVLANSIGPDDNKADLSTNASAPAAPARRLLLFWPVDNAKRTVAQVKKNVQYIRSVLGDDCCHVMLAHYKGNPIDWGSQWYRDNVKQSYTGPGFKFKFMRDAYMKAKNTEESWESTYEYVWGLDSDLDITGTNLTKLLGMARLSNSLIVGPTFVGKGVTWVKPSFVHGKKIRKKKAAKHAPKGPRTHASHAQKVEPQHVDAQSSKASSLQEQAHQVIMEQSDVSASRSREELQSSIWTFERPSPKCDYRHTDFVELTAPLLSPAALPIVFNDCTDCIHDSSDWGLDMVWCKFLADRKKHSSSCALIDATPVNHLNWKQAKISKAFLAANKDVWHKYRKYWSGLKTLSCIIVEPAVKVNNVEELELPGNRHLIRKAGRRKEMLKAEGAGHT